MTDPLPLLSADDLLPCIERAGRDALLVAHVETARVVYWSPGAQDIFGYYHEV